jgi:tRNA G18 (ribose-2'-O)-methylase SpoU
MSDILHITDPEDARIAPYRQVRERDLVGRDGRFIAEGEVVLRAVARAGRHPLSSVLMAEKRLDALSGVLEALPGKPTVYVADQSVLDAIVGFHIHRGILALGEAVALPSAEELLASLGEQAMVLVLFGIGNHDNMGGIFRNAAAFGADAVLLAPDCCDPLYRKAIRVSVGAVLTTPFARIAPDEEPIELLARHGFTPLALSPAGETVLADLHPPARAAVLLGSEGPGLASNLLARARTISIPMTGGFDSLNVATTSGIVLHQLRFGGSR